MQCIEMLWSRTKTMAFICDNPGIEEKMGCIQI